MDTQMLVWGLEELADKAMQERVWLGRSPGQMSSFEEAVSRVFDDSGLDRYLFSAPDPTILSLEAQSKARRLGRLVDGLPMHAAPLDIVRHPDMRQIRQVASELLLLLKFGSSSREHLTAAG